MKRAKKSGLRPTDGEIDLEARQWAEEYATRCENTQITRQEIFAAGARWARGVAQLGRPNPAVTVPPLVADKVDELVGRPNDLSETKTGD